MHIFIIPFFYLDIKINRQPRVPWLNAWNWCKNFFNDTFFDAIVGKRERNFENREGIFEPLYAMSRPFSRPRSPFPSLVSLSRHAFNNSWLCRTRDSSWIFHVCTAGNAVVAEKSNYSRRRSTSMAHRRPKLPVLGGKRTAKRGNEHGTAMLNKGAIRSASPARWKYILYLNTAATLLRALHFRCDCVYCPNQSYTSGYILTKWSLVTDSTKGRRSR